MGFKNTIGFLVLTHKYISIKFALVLYKLVSGFRFYIFQLLGDTSARFESTFLFLWEFAMVSNGRMYHTQIETGVGLARILDIDLSYKLQKGALENYSKLMIFFKCYFLSETGNVS